MQQALSWGSKAIDKSHLSEGKGVERGLNHDVQRLGAENDTVLSPKTEETQLAALSSKY